MKRRHQICEWIKDGEVNSKYVEWNNQHIKRSGKMEFWVGSHQLKKNENYHLLSAYYMIRDVLSILHILFYLILTITLQGTHYHTLHTRGTEAKTGYAICPSSQS